MAEVTLEKLVSLAKRRGFAFPSAEIYGGINGVYDFGPMGTLLRQNIKNLWMKSVSGFPEEILFMDGSQLGPEAVWKASGHVDSFSDPMVDCTNCKKRYRADDIDLNKSCPSCGIKNWTDVRQFQMMFKTQLGAVSDQASVAYLRPETAQSIFVNFKNVMTASRAKIPFGIAQIGKAFRNEITPKQFLFRMREFEQMELEFFCKDNEADDFFELWVERRFNFFSEIGIRKEKLRKRKHEKDELAHYAKDCTDVEYEFPWGFKELEGIAHRSAYDLTQHTKFSGKDLSVFEEEAETKSFVPTVIESSVGVDRLMLTLLFDAYYEDEVEGEVRTVLRFSPQVAPIKAAIMPLSKQLAQGATEIYMNLKRQGISVQYDLSGSIGKRYRRHDEIGTPFCFTYDFESPQDNKVTVRDRDSLKQERIAIEYVAEYLREKIK